MNEMSDLQEIGYCAKAISYGVNVDVYREKLHRLIDSIKFDTGTTGLWLVVVHMMIMAGEIDLATRIIHAFIDTNIRREDMKRALSLLDEGKLVAAAYVARGTLSYNAVIPAELPAIVIEEILALPPQARVLDIGCGTGLSGVALRNAHFQGSLTGVDLVEDMVAAVPQGIYDELATADACEWLAADQRRWDAIISFGVFVHLPEPTAQRLIGLAANRLNQGGVLAFNASEREAPIMHALPLAKATGIFEAAGLDLEAVKRDTGRTTYLCRKLAA